MHQDAFVHKNVWSLSDASIHTWFLLCGFYNGNGDETTKESSHVESCNLRKPESLRVVIATRDTASRAWFIGAVDELIAKYSAIGVSELLSQVHMTGDAASEAEQPLKIPEDVNTPNLLVALRLQRGLQ
jgi:hypothetical protein